MLVYHPVLTELIESGHLTMEQAYAIHEEHLTQGKPVLAIAIEEGFFDEQIYLKTIARILDTEVIEHLDPKSGVELEKTVPADVARIYGIVPVRIENDTVVVAIGDLPTPAATDDIAFVLSKRIGYVVAPQGEIDTAIKKLYGERSDADMLIEIDEGAAELADLEHAVNATPVIRFVNMVLFRAVNDRASDIHFEPFEHEFKIRYRIDGTLYEMVPPPTSLALPVISRIKVIAGLDIAEHRLPQDGRIQLKVSGRSIDFRVSTLPTQFGESVVLRILDRSNLQLDIHHIGLPDDIKQPFMEDIHKPNGIVIVTGPTGSGKTTTLYAALQQINTTETKILTAEDPVEYDIEGVIQLPIREGIGLTFHKALRSFLRQDPDIIMVGEIRDLETAQIAVQASLTGHLVFSTLHTNDAPGTITRLSDMGVEPYLIASSLEAAMGQRLLRTICPHCKTTYQPSVDALESLGIDDWKLGHRPFHRGKGCEACNHTGYSGRRAIFEYMRINDSLRAAIIDRLPTVALNRKAVEHGMRTLRADGIRCIIDGYTTVDEVIQYT